MIKGIHGLFYSSKPKELRAFLRDKLRLPFTDIHDGWLIFDFPEGDLGVHPTDGNPSMSGTHDISFFTDDVAGTVRELKGRGVKFDDAIEDHGYGLVTHFTMPGGVRVQLYQPHYRKNPRPARGRKTKKTPGPRRRKPAVKKKA